MADLCTLVELKAYLKITASMDDALLETLIDAATDMIEDFCGRSLSAASYTEYYDGNGDDSLHLRNYPVNSITELNLDSSRTWGDSTKLVQNEDFVLDASAGIVRLISSLSLTNGGVTYFPRGRRIVKATYNAGYSTIPARLKLACEELASHLYHNRGSTRNVQSHSIGGFSETFGNGSAVAIPDNVKAMLTSEVKYDLDEQNVGT